MRTWHSVLLAAVLAPLIGCASPPKRTEPPPPTPDDMWGRIWFTDEDKPHLAPEHVHGGVQ